VSDYPPIPIICGPTAAGKTSLALTYADKAPVEIISADSRQVIRKLDIGTAKPTPAERKQAPFHMVDIIEPGERYSAFRFLTEANQILREIFARGHVPLVVGGTGLYLQALSDGVVEIEKEDVDLRERLEKEAEAGGLELMHRRLAEVDPLDAAKIHPRNRARVIRALEIYYLTGKPKSELLAAGAYKRSEFEFDYYCLAPERRQLYEIINRRVDAMLVAGWLDEIRTLCDKGLAEQVRRARVIGYSELLDYLDGRCGREEAVALIKQNTRRYAKRQMTWFRGRADCRFFADADALRRRLSLAGFESHGKNG
jgi:tRNA dimethylallyltransferase